MGVCEIPAGSEGMCLYCGGRDGTWHIPELGQSPIACDECLNWAITRGFALLRDCSAAAHDGGAGALLAEGAPESKSALCFECSQGHAANRYHAIGCPLYLSEGASDA